MGRFTGLLGLLTMLALAFAFSTNRRAIRLKTVAWGLGLQFVLAVFVLPFVGDPIGGRACNGGEEAREHENPNS